MMLGEEGFARLSRSRVAVFGVGGVGGWCAECLVRTGVGSLTIVDGDIVAPSNANRQAMAAASTIGEAKVEAMRRRLLDINPSAEIRAVGKRYCAETASSFAFDGFDAVVDAIDSVDCKALLASNAVATPGLAFFSSMGAAKRFDPFKVRAGEFRKVEGDGLAKALRARFRREYGGFPGGGRFMCVWSAEPPATNVLGSLAQVTAVFGFCLASLVVAACTGRAVPRSCR